ncbi:MAG: Na+/H+ antiporter NhaC family protein, partial [Prevotella sp.]|nr:Na+/H+ antiporter NhaC family protein [Prevotella sp.]
MLHCKSSKSKGLWALSPLAVFIVLYLVTSIIARDFYKVPITVAFMAASAYAVVISGGIPLRKRIDIYSQGAATGQMMLMLWIFILAGAFAHTAKMMGAIDATVNLSLTLLPGNMLLAGLFLAACFISLSVGTSVGTIVALTPIAA